ncbi:hypothetical protein BSKO_06210 [Bryopsis sp. KO-2023]|nr:hypothetical protein BSKO_06210 [Bryopsis sp. KO-2023]
MAAGYFGRPFREERRGFVPKLDHDLAARVANVQKRGWASDVAKPYKPLGSPDLSAREPLAACSYQGLKNAAYGAATSCFFPAIVKHDDHADNPTLRKYEDKRKGNGSKELKRAVNDSFVRLDWCRSHTFESAVKTQRLLAEFQNKEVQELTQPQTHGSKVTNGGRRLNFCVPDFQTSIARRDRISKNRKIGLTQDHPWDLNGRHKSARRSAIAFSKEMRSLGNLSIPPLDLSSGTMVPGALSAREGSTDLENLFSGRRSDGHDGGLLRERSEESVLTAMPSAEWSVAAEIGSDSEDAPASGTTL